MTTSEGRTVYFAVTIGSKDDTRVVSYWTSPQAAMDALVQFARIHEKLIEPIGLLITTEEPDERFYAVDVAGGPCEEYQF